MTAQTNCPNCGAILNRDGGLHCDYCGAVFEKPEPDCEEVVFYSDDGPYYSTTRGLLTTDADCVISFEFAEKLAKLANQGHRAKAREVAAVMLRLREKGMATDGVIRDEYGYIDWKANGWPEMTPFYSSVMDEALKKMPPDVFDYWLDACNEAEMQYEECDG